MLYSNKFTLDAGKLHSECQLIDNDEIAFCPLKKKGSALDSSCLPRIAKCA